MSKEYLDECAYLNLNIFCLCSWWKNQLVFLAYVNKSKMEFIIFTEVYSAILEIITVSSSELEHSIKALSQRRTTLEPAIKITFALLVLLLIWEFLPLLPTFSRAWQDAVMWVFIFTSLSVEDNAGNLAGICRKWIVSQLHISKNEIGIFFIHIKCCVRGGACWGGIDVEHTSLP